MSHKKSFIFLIVSIGALIALTDCTQPYKKIIHNIDDNARCLDGSPAALYEHIGQQSNKFLIYFGGGGSCGGMTSSQTLQNCYQRSKTYLGSSKYMLDQLRPQGMSTTDPTKSRFATWSKFIFAYCDGSFHQGNRVAPVSYKDAKLYFRGADITRAHIKYMIQKYQFDKAIQVVISGISAGAMASYLWANQFKRIFPDPNVQFVTVLDSGLFINDTSVQTRKYKSQIMIQNLYKLSNLNQQTPFKQCNLITKQKPWHCFFFQNSYSLIKGPVLNIISLYDAYDLKYQYEINCITVGSEGQTFLNCTDKEKKAIQSRRQKALAINSKFMQLSPTHSSWAISCANHVYTGNWKFYMSQNQTVSGMEVKQAIQSFVIDKQRIDKVDSVAWPGNAKCAY